MCFYGLYSKSCSFHSVKSYHANALKDLSCRPFSVSFRDKEHDNRGRDQDSQR